MRHLVFDDGTAKTGQVRRLALRLLALVASLLLGTCLALVDTTAAFACSCAGISSNRALREADVVFRGTVSSKDQVGRSGDARIDIRFLVDEVYKGTVYRDQVVASSLDSRCMWPRPGDRDHVGDLRHRGH